MALDAVLDVHHAHLGIHEHGQLAVQVGNDDRAVAARPRRALDRRWVHRHHLDARLGGHREHRPFALVLGAVVDRQIGAAVGAVLGADRARGLTE
jgi:hypothetical protein